MPVIFQRLPIRRPFLPVSPQVTILWWVNNAESDLPSCCRGKVLYLYLSRFFVINGTNIYRKTCWMRLKCRNFMVKYGIRTGFPRLVARGTVRIHTRPRHPRARIGPALSLSGSSLRRAAGYCVFSHHGQWFFCSSGSFFLTR